MTPSRCVECGGELDEGFVTDYHAMAFMLPARWIKGAPERSALTGTKKKGKVGLEIVAYRCRRCGVMRFVAPVPGK